MDYSPTKDSDLNSDTYNKTVSLPFIQDTNKNEDLVLRSSYSYRHFIYQRSTGKYIIKSGIYNYTHNKLLGNNDTSENQLCTKKISENDRHLMTRNSVDCIKGSTLEKMPTKPLKIRTLETGNPTMEKGTCLHYFYNCLNILLIFLIISIFYSYFITWLPRESVFLENLEQKLSSNLLNQNIAVSTLSKSVEKLHEEGNKKILTCLIGSTGVGKTYSINLLQHFLKYKIIHVFRSSDLSNFFKDNSFRSDLLHLVISSRYIIIVFDDLKVNDLGDVQSFIQTISQLEEVNLLLILIFNIQHTDDNLFVSINYRDLAFIKENLEMLFQHFYFTQFNELNESVVKTWLKRELQFKNVSENYHNRIINKLLNVQDVKTHGLKGISSKLSIELADNF